MSKGAALAAGQRVSAPLRMARAELLLPLLQSSGIGGMVYACISISLLFSG